MKETKTKYIAENWTGHTGTKYLMDIKDVNENMDKFTDDIWEATLFNSVVDLNKAVPKGWHDTTKAKPITITYEW